jgi:hypothetical protein
MYAHPNTQAFEYQSLIVIEYLLAEYARYNLRWPLNLKELLLYSETPKQS